MAALFGHSSAGRSSTKNLVEFRAGKMSLNKTTVTPDKRKGQVYIYQSEDSLMHFCWKDRTAGKLEDVSCVRSLISQILLKLHSVAWSRNSNM